MDAASASSRASAAAAAVKRAGQAFDRGTTHPSCGFRKSPRGSFSKEVSALTGGLFSRIDPENDESELNAPKPARVLSRGVLGGAESTAPALARPPELDRLTSLCPLTPPGTGTSAPRDTSHSNAKTNDEEEVRKSISLAPSSFRVCVSGSEAELFAGAGANHTRRVICSWSATRLPLSGGKWSRSPFEFARAAAASTSASSSGAQSGFSVSRTTSLVYSGAPSFRRSREHSWRVKNTPTPASRFGGPPGGTTLRAETDARCRTPSGGR